MSTLSFRLTVCAALFAVSLMSPFVSLPARADAPQLAGKKILFLGDSITHDGMYVMLVEYYLDKQFPNSKFDIYSLGLSSETVSGLSEKAHPFPRPCVHERLWAALDVIKPDVVFACYGMNDGIYHPESPDRMAAFQLGIHKLIAECHAAGASVVILTPPPYDPLPNKGSVRPITADDFSYLNPYDHYDDVLTDYAKWEMTLPGTDATVIDLHTPLLNYILDQRKTDPNFSVAPDGIHPNPMGQIVMARTILAGLGLVAQTDNVNDELTRLNADPMWALVQNHNRTRADGWTAYIGFTRDTVVKLNSIDKTESDASTLQMKIDQLRVGSQNSTPASIGQTLKTQ